MTRRELYSVYNLKDKARLLAMTRASLLATAEDLVPITDNMPHSKSVKSRVEELAIKILEVDAELDKVREQIIQTPDGKTIMLDFVKPKKSFADIEYEKWLKERDNEKERDTIVQSKSNRMD